MPTKIIFSGLGAIGGYYGAMVAKGAEELLSTRVYFYLRQGEHLTAIRKFGLRVSSPKLDFYAHPTLATDKVEDLPKADILVLSTKEYDLNKNLKELSPVITSNTIIMTTQNGLTAPLLVEQLFPENLIVPSACHITCRKTPGLITVRSDENLLKFGTDSTLKIQASEQKWMQIENFFLLLRASGVRCKLYKDMAPMLKEKFIMLSPSAVSTAYYNLPIGEVIRLHQAELKELIHELASLYQAMGNRNDLFIEDDAFRAIDKMPKVATTSMHSDILNHHKSEIETLIGFVIKTAKKLHVKTPLYEEFYNAIKNKIKTDKN